MTLLGAMGVLSVSIYFMVQIPGSFIPPDDVGRISVSVELAPGSSLQDTDEVTRQMYEAVRDIGGVENVFALGGSSPTGERDIRRASLTVLLYRKSHSLVQKLADMGNSIPVFRWLVPNLIDTGRTIPQNVVEVEVFKRLHQIPDVRAVKLNDRGERDLSYSILSTDEDSLNLGVSMLESALRGDPALADVATQGALPRPELQVTPRPEESARLGITTRKIADVLRVATIGDIDAALAKLSIDNRLIPVRVRLNDESRNDLARIAALMIPTASGAAVPLSSVADVVIAQGPSTVQRFNRERRAILGANLPVGVALGTALARFEEITKNLQLPEGVRIEKSGDAEVQQELIASFGKAMILGLMLVLTVLILLFKSVIQPFTILFSLPLAIGGVAVALIITGSAVSMPVLIGILMLMGIVTKNAILLVDFAVEMRAQGLDRFSALVEAGHKRARPIVMTSIAMSAGMLPSALGVGEGGSFRAPMATAVIGGIIASTILSLVIVPSFFLIMDDLSEILAKIFSRLVGKKEPEVEAPANADLALQISALSNRLAVLEVKSPIDQLK
jgi:multidrug efflux pump subunit AcrB